MTPIRERFEDAKLDFVVDAALDQLNEAHWLLGNMTAPREQGDLGKFVGAIEAIVRAGRLLRLGEPIDKRLTEIVLVDVSHGFWEATWEPRGDDPDAPEHRGLPCEP